MSGSNKIIVDSKNNISDEQLEISVKTFFGHKITVVEESGDYKVKSTGIKGLGDKILWFIYAPTLKSRQAAVEESLKNNSGSTNDKRTSSNIQNVQSLWQIGNSQNSQFSIDNYGKKKMFDDPGKTNQTLNKKNQKMILKKSENFSNERLEQSKNSKDIELDNNAHEESSSKVDYNNNIKIVDDPDDSNFQLLSNEKDNIGNQTNINNGIKNNNSNEISAADNDFSIFKDVKNDEFSVFKNENNNINSDGENQNLAKNDVNNMGYDNLVLSEEELDEIKKGAENLIKDGFLEEKGKAEYINSMIKETIEKKKMDRENALFNEQIEEEIKKSNLEEKCKENARKEAENNLKKIIPEGYRVTSSERGDKIKGDGNCFYRAIAKLEKGNQEGYGEIRKTISDEINKSAELFGESADKIDDNLLPLLENYAGEYNELKNVEVAENNLAIVLYQIKEHVEDKDKKNEYAGPIEAYFYAKATKKAVIIYDSNNQISVFIPGEDGNSVNVKHMAPDKIESYIEENNIDITAAVKLAYNAVGRHYEAIVQDVKN